jgi:hypothetical protein
VSGDLIVLATQDGRALVFATDGRQLSELANHGSDVIDVAVAPSVRRAAIALDDGLIRQFDLTSGVEREVLRPLESAGRAWTVAWSTDGTRVAAGYDDGAVRVWDADTGEQVATFPVATGDTVIEVAFDPQGSRLAVSTALNPLVRILDCDVCGSLDEVIGLARSRVTRSLTPQERATYLHEAAPDPSQDLPSASATPSPAASPGGASQPPTPGPTPDPLGAHFCEGHEVCALDAGRYHPTPFSIGLTVELGVGWSSTFSIATAFDISRPEGNPAIGFAADISEGLRGATVVSVAPGAAAMEAHLRSTPGLIVSQARVTSVGGRPAVTFDVTAEPTATAPISIFQTSGVTYVVAPGEHDRFWLVEVDGQTLVVDYYGSNEERFQAGIALAEDVVASIRFAH